MVKIGWEGSERAWLEGAEKVASGHGDVEWEAVGAVADSMTAEVVEIRCSGFHGGLKWAEVEAQVESHPEWTVDLDVGRPQGLARAYAAVLQSQGGGHAQAVASLRRMLRRLPLLGEPTLRLTTRPLGSAPAEGHATLLSHATGARLVEFGRFRAVHSAGESFLSSWNASWSPSANMEPDMEPIRSDLPQTWSLAHEIQHESVATIRAVSADMVSAANSGHPGMPMGMAPAAYVLAASALRADPRDAHWPNRDRWVLSNGHGSALQYTVLHLLGYEGLERSDLQQFRQLGSRTPGHPEVHVTSGIEVNTGPLGQGVAQGVGLALAGKHVGQRWGDASLSNHRVVVFCGDGCLMEGVALEALSLAGHLQLDNLVVLYDDNGITIDGPTSLAFTQDVTALGQSAGWAVRTVEHADTDLRGVASALDDALSGKCGHKPVLLRLRTTIGFGAKKEGTSAVHGSPLPKDEVAAFRVRAGLDPEPFAVSDWVRADFAAISAKMTAGRSAWEASILSTVPPSALEERTRWLTGSHLPKDWKHKLPEWKNEIEEEGVSGGRMEAPAGGMATRVASGKVLEALAKVLPGMVGGSADLTPSNNSLPSGWADCRAADGFGGRYVRYGVREHAMVAIGNGLAMHGSGLMPYVATFLVFVGYALGAVRTGALGHAPLLIVGTHDSIGVGEDGPTHQPVETLAQLRAMPHVCTLRPADANEVAGCYELAVENWAESRVQARRTLVLALSRQNVPVLARSRRSGVRLGGYSVLEPRDGRTPAVVLLASGSEVSLAVAAAEAVRPDLDVRVVSVPCLELLARQDEPYLRSLLPDLVPVVSVEAAASLSWGAWAHFHIAIDSFGASAPAPQVYAKLGLSVDRIVSVLRKIGLEKPSTLSIVDRILFQRSIGMDLGMH